eukprot:8058093-Pyramimonas_sp.AAC.1
MPAASHDRTAPRSPRRLRRFGFPALSCLEVLGLEVDAGKPVHSRVLRRRVKAMSKRVRHFQRILGLGAKSRKVASAAI